MPNKMERLEQIKRYCNLPLLKFGMYIEINGVDHGYLIDADYDHIIVSNGLKKMPYHPKWEIVYYDNPINKNIIYDFRSI